MPHLGQLKAMLGTLRGEGPVEKRDNSLIVIPAPVFEWDDLEDIQWDDGDRIEL